MLPDSLASVVLLDHVQLPRTCLAVPVRSGMVAGMLQCVSGRLSRSSFLCFPLLLGTCLSGGCKLLSQLLALLRRSCLSAPLLLCLRFLDLAFGVGKVVAETYLQEFLTPRPARVAHNIFWRWKFQVSGRIDLDQHRVVAGLQFDFRADAARESIISQAPHYVVVFSVLV